MAAALREVDPVERLRELVGRHDTQREAAAALAISGAYLSDLLNGRREFSPAILERLGLRRIVVAANGRKS